MSTKKQMANMTELSGMIVTAMTMGIWDLVEESAVTMSPMIGDELLTLIEKKAGLELNDEDPEKILTELGQIYVDDYGYGSKVTIDRDGKIFKMTFFDAVGLENYIAIEEMGVEKPFSNPIYCTGLAALARLGLRARATTEVDMEKKTFTATFKVL